MNLLYKFGVTIPMLRRLRDELPPGVRDIGWKLARGL